MAPILGRTQDESSSRLLHHSCACLKRDAADGPSNCSLELRQSRWVALVDHLLDVTPQKEIWGCQAGGLWRSADGGARRNDPTAHTLGEPFQGLPGGMCWCSILLDPLGVTVVSAQRCCREVMNSALGLPGISVDLP